MDTRDDEEKIRLRCMDCKRSQERTVDECWRMPEPPECGCGGAMTLIRNDIHE